MLIFCVFELFQLYYSGHLKLYNIFINFENSIQSIF